MKKLTVIVFAKSTIQSIIHSFVQQVLVKKLYSDSSRRMRKRKWKLHHLNEQMETDKHKDYNDFLEDLEEDPAFRANVNIYKGKQYVLTQKVKNSTLSLIDFKVAKYVAMRRGIGPALYYLLQSLLFSILVMVMMGNLFYVFHKAYTTDI